VAEEIGQDESPQQHDGMFLRDQREAEAEDRRGQEREFSATEDLSCPEIGDPGQKEEDGGQQLGPPHDISDGLGVDRVEGENGGGKERQEPVSEQHPEENIHEGAVDGVEDDIHQVITPWSEPSENIVQGI
jgi:hypothetical protein